jgi:hypothetical protein
LVRTLNGKEWNCTRVDDSDTTIIHIYIYIPQNSNDIPQIHLHPFTIVTSTKVSLNVIVCGGSIGGLGCAIGLAQRGHSVTVLESATSLNEFGAGIQIPPNSVQILDTSGMKDKIEAVVTKPNAINLRRYKTGEILNATTDLDPRMTEAYG